MYKWGFWIIYLLADDSIMYVLVMVLKLNMTSESKRLYLHSGSPIGC